MKEAGGRNDDGASGTASEQVNQERQCSQSQQPEPGGSQERDRCKMIRDAHESGRLRFIEVAPRVFSLSMGRDTVYTDSNRMITA